MADDQGSIVDATPDVEVQEDLYEELSAYEQAMISEDRQNEGTFFSGGNSTIAGLVLDEEQPLDEERVLNVKPVKDGSDLLEFLRKRLHKFESPYAYIGGEANSPDFEGYEDAEVKILITRLSTYESTSLSMSHSLMAQIYAELPRTFTDLAFLPKPKDYVLLRDNGFPVWFGLNTKLAPDKFDVISITHAVAMEHINFVGCIHDSGIPLFKEQRMEREDVPLLIVGGANSGTTAPLSGEFRTADGRSFAHFIDCVVYGDGEDAAKEFIEVVREGKQKSWTKREVLRACHGRVEGFYEPDCYVHEYDGKGNIREIRRAEGREYADFPVRRATVLDLDTVRTLETKIIPYTGDGASVDVAIAGSVGCIGSSGWGACSFCREGSEGPYRERTLPRVMEALDAATRNQGTKEVSFFSLNFNQYTDLFPLVMESVKRGYKVGLISQRVDMLAETPEQIRVQRWLKKSNFTLGVEGLSNRMRAYLNKNLQEWEILVCATEMMKMGAGELKIFLIATGLETELDITEWNVVMEKINAIRLRLGASTRFRISFTPLVPSAYTVLQFAPVNSGIMHGKRTLTPVFERAKELGWGRRLSTSGEEPLLANTLGQGGRNTTMLLIKAHFQDNYRFYGTVPKGTWLRWKRRIDEDDNISLRVLWHEKAFEHVFPWEDFAYSTSKEVLWRGYLKAVAFQGVTYCLSTRTIKGVCHVNECGACDPAKTGKPITEMIQKIVGRRVAPTIPLEVIERAARSREKTIHLRVLFDLRDPIYRFVSKGYYSYAIARALMTVSDQFNNAFVQSLGHARISAGAHTQKDWVYGQNIYDFSLCEHMTEEQLRALIEPANRLLRGGRILDLRMESQMKNLRSNVDFAVYSMFVPNDGCSFRVISTRINKFFERAQLGRAETIKIKVTKGKGVFVTEERTLDGKDVRSVEYQWQPEQRGTVLRFVISANYNPLAMLEALTGRAQFRWKPYPIYCEGYVHLNPFADQEIDVFAALSRTTQRCKETGGVLEQNIFTGEHLSSGISLASSVEATFPLDMDVFFTKELRAVELRADPV